MKKYSGNTRPYLYAIFADGDEAQAMELLEKISESGYRLTYREKNAADAISRSALVLLIVSDAILGDREIERQLRLAAEAGRKVITLFLRPTVLTPELRFLVGQTQGIRGQRGEEQVSVQELLDSPALREMTVSPRQRQRFRRRLIAGSALLAAIALAAAILFFNGVFSASRPGGERLRELGVSGNFSRVREVYLYGEERKEDYLIPRFASRRDKDSWAVIYGEEQYAYGELTDISDFSLLKNVEELCLSGNRIESIQPLLTLKKLRLLDLSGNSGVSLDGISALQNLEVLNLYETAEGEADAEVLRELLALPRLKTLYVSSAQQEASMSLPGRRFEVIALDTAVSTFAELKQALAEPGPADITVTARITVPEGETLTVGAEKNLGGSSTAGQEELIFTNNGTILLFGRWEMGLCTRVNNGTVEIRPGGVYNGGMCDTKNHGRFVIESGGTLRLNRAHAFSMDGGELINRGDIRLGGCGELRVTGGKFFNEGAVYYEGLFFGGLSVSRQLGESTGHAYISVSEPEEEWAYQEVGFWELEDYNHFS